MKGRLVTFAAVLLVLLTTATPLHARKKHANEAGAWNIKITPDAAAAEKGEKATADVLILQQGFLKLKGGGERGFGTGPYTQRGPSITAEIKSAYEGKMDWSANWTEDTMAGRITLTRRDGSVLTYTFSGVRAPVEKAKKRN